MSLLHEQLSPSMFRLRMCDVQGEWGAHSENGELCVEVLQHKPAKRYDETVPKAWVPVPDLPQLVEGTGDPEDYTWQDAVKAPCEQEFTTTQPIFGLRVRARTWSDAASGGTLALDYSPPRRCDLLAGGYTANYIVAPKHRPLAQAVVLPDANSTDEDGSDVQLLLSTTRKVSTAVKSKANTAAARKLLRRKVEWKMINTQALESENTRRIMKLTELEAECSELCGTAGVMEEEEIAATAARDTSWDAKTWNGRVAPVGLVLAGSELRQPDAELLRHAGV